MSDPRPALSADPSAAPSPSPSAHHYEPARGVARLATAADNDRLLALFSEVPMRGALTLTTERSPDMFALYAIQQAHTECWVYEVDGRLLGMGTAVIRDGWVDGQPQKVAYLGDLRVSRAPEARGALPALYSEVLDGIRARHGCEHCYTGILASNERALRALTAYDPRRAHQPRYDLLRRYDAVQVQLTRAVDARRMPFIVRAATPADLPVASAFLAAQHRRRPFGYRFDQGELAHRLSAWPGFSLSQTYLAFDAQGDLCGVTTAWDAGQVKRYRVLAYGRQLRVARFGYNLAARLLGYAPLPPAGGCLRYRYLANLAVRDEDPRILRALLATITRAMNPSRDHFIMFYLEEGSRLAPALEGFSVRRLPFQLFAVRPPTSAPHRYPSDVPTGFEIALA
jgi:hypothetical protein